MVYQGIQKQVQALDKNTEAVQSVKKIHRYFIVTFRLIPDSGLISLTQFGLGPFYKTNQWKSSLLRK